MNISSPEQWSTAERAGLDLAEFEKALVRLRYDTPGNSQVLKTLSAVAVDALHDETFPEYREAMLDFMDARPEMDPDLKVNTWWRSYQLDHLQAKDPTYPDGHADYYICRQGMEATYKDPERAALNYEIISTHKNQTNEPGRYGGVRLPRFLNSDILPQYPTMVDVGCSFDLGQTVTTKNLPLPNTRFETDEVSEKILRNLWLGRTALTFGRAVGIDAYPQRDRRWVEACSYYPEELNDADKKAFREKVYSLHGRTPVIMGDITDQNDPGLQTARNKVKGRRFHIATEVTAFYEIPVEYQDVAQQNLENLASRLVVSQDYAEIDPQNPERLIYTPKIYHASARYNLFVKRLVGEEAGVWNLLGSYDSGRCRVFTPSEYTIERLQELRAAS